ncbi:MAG TPA: glycosyltransferase family 39 protein [Thermomicrobiales bacterium]|nr:glycosyltransferase family 39 protein [Thermomicrobiales bacterium]
MERKTWSYAATLMFLAVCCAMAFPFWPNRLLLLDMGKLVGYGWSSFLPWITGILLWVAALIALCWQFRGRTWTQTRVLVISTTAVVYVMFIAMYPTSAIDVYIYAARSRLFSHYHQNPNAVEPIVYWDIDPYMHFASKEWADNLSPYGPLWNTLAYPVTAIGGESIGAAIIGFKLLSVISIVIMSWLIYDIVRIRREEWAMPAAVFLLWNPLVMWDGIGNAHNDITLMLPVVAALWCWARRLDQWIVPLLVASVLVKYVTVILLPVAVVALWRRNPQWHIRISAAFWGIAWSVILITISLFPFYDLGAILESAEAQGNRISLSPAWVVRATMAERGWAPPENDTVRIVAYALMSVYIGGWMLACWKDPSRLPRAMFEVMFAFMWIASTNQRHWYVLWIVPLGAALIPGTPWRRTLLWSITALFGHGCTIWLWYVYDIKLRGYYGYGMLIVAIVYGPVLLLTLWELGNAFIARKVRKPVTSVSAAD